MGQSVINRCMCPVLLLDDLYAEVRPFITISRFLIEPIGWDCCILNMQGQVEPTVQGPDVSLAQSSTPDGILRNSQQLWEMSQKCPWREDSPATMLLLVGDDTEQQEVPPMDYTPWRPESGTEKNFHVGLGVRGSSVILVSVVSVERGWQRLLWTDSSSESGQLCDASFHQCLGVAARQVESHVVSAEADLQHSRWH